MIKGFIVRKKDCSEFDLSNLLIDSGLCKLITDYHPNIQDEIQRGHLQKGPYQSRLYNC